MKNTKKAVTLVEAVITLAILSIGLIGVYKLYNNSIRFLDGVAAKTQAIQIAREGIEAVENIRDTNWQLFPSNTECCWNVLNYNSECILETVDSTTQVCTYISGVGSQTSDKMNGTSNGETYILKKTNIGKWKLETLPGVTTYEHSDSAYRDAFKIKQDANGIYFQGTEDDKSDPSFNGKKFTRRIEIRKKNDIAYLDENGAKKDDGKGIEVKSIVEWRDMSSSGVRRIELSNLMTNHKK